MFRIITQVGDRRALALVALIALQPALAGCGANEDGRIAVAGHVTYEGQPLQQGQVVFEPRGAGRMAIGHVVDGRYTIAAQRGPIPGEYVVRITSTRATGEKASAGPTGGNELRDVYEQFLPEKYNDRSELVVKIEGSSSVEQDFDLTSG